MKGIDPKYIMYLGLLVTVEEAIGHGTVSLTHLVPDTWAPYITSWCNFLAFVGTSIMTYQAAVSGPQVGPLVKAPELPPFTPTVVKILALAFVPLLLFANAPAKAQARPLRLTGNLVRDIQNANTQVGNQVKAAVTGQTADPTAPLACMDITMLPKLTLANLMPTMKQCFQDGNTQLVSDTQRALDSAKAFTGSATGSGSAVGDNDAINCLTPALALFKAAAIVPAVPGTPEVPATATAPAIPAVAAVPEQDPGPILLAQKFREFTLAGGITACQAWINEPIQAVAAGGVGAVGTALGGAAALSGGVVP